MPERASREGGNMKNESGKVCPVELASSLDNKVRRWLQDPRKILAPYVTEGMTVLDVGCGPGFFSIEAAKLAGETGRVISADLQPGMLEIIGRKIKGTALERRITAVQCRPDHINVTDNVDFIIAFYMVHEVPDKAALFRQLRAILKKDGRLLLVEPKMFHVSKNEFDATLNLAAKAGFTITQGPKLLLSWSAILMAA